MTVKDEFAFPVSVAMNDAGDVTCSGDFVAGNGLTKREMFAMAAMQGLMSGKGIMSADWGSTQKDRIKYE